MLDTGIRVKEAVNLEIDDVDIKRKVIVIRGEISKTRSFRELPISLDTCKKFREIIKISKEYNRNYVFLNELGGKLSSATVSWCFRNYGKKAGITGRCSPHVFRHTFATNFIRKGGGMYRIMGHSTLLTTRRYIQLDIEDLKQKYKKFSLLEEYL
jgi:integrase/recombinase XerD